MADTPVIIEVPGSDSVSIEVGLVESVVIEISDAPIGAAPVVIEVLEGELSIETSSDEPALIEVGVPGPAGPAGPAADLVSGVKPSSVLQYDVDGRLDSVDYADGRTKQLTYDVEGQLITVVVSGAGFPTVTKDLSYSGGALVAVDVVVS